MIIEINRAATLIPGPLTYNLTKLHENVAEILTTKWIPKDSCDKEIRMTLEANVYRRKCAKPFAHLSINPALSDDISKEKFQQIVKFAMSELFPGVPYIAFLHKDIERPHVHVVCPVIKRDGTFISDSFEHRRAMKVSRAIEERWQLESALKGAKERRIGRAAPVDYEAGNLARSIGDVLELAKTFQISSLNELNVFLQYYNVKAEQISTDKKKGMVYYVLNKDGLRVSRPIVASKVHGGSLSSIEKHFKDSAKNLGENGKCYHSRVFLRGRILQNRQNAITFAEFAERLSKERIHVAQNKDAEGKVLGITFIDFENKIVMKGSAIDRECSYLNIMDVLTATTTSNPTIDGHRFTNDMPLSVEASESKTENSVKAAISKILSPTGLVGIIGSEKKKKKRRW